MSSLFLEFNTADNDKSTVIKSSSYTR